MDITFVLAPNLLGLLGLIILLIFTHFNFYLEERKLALFVATDIINIAIILFELADYLLGLVDFPSAYLLRRFTSASGFALTPVLPLALAFIASKKKLSRWFALPAGVNIVLSYVSMITGRMFMIDSYNSYFRGPHFYVMMGISLFYLLLLIYISFENMKTVRSGEAIFLLGIVAAILCCNLLEIIFSFHFLTWNGCAILLITYYLFLHIQYFKYDPLTNVYNRNMFNNEVKSLSRKTCVGILSFDLNGLKQVNDQRGHEKGDEYIIKAAQVIDRCFQHVGSLFRIGGDEFVVTIANTSTKKIEELLKNFHKECAKAGVSIACGYSFHEMITDPSQMLRDADQAMYTNKRDRMLNR